MAGEGGGKTDNLSFQMQIGLVRESVTVQMEGGNLTLTTLKDIACAFVDRKVCITLVIRIFKKIFFICLNYVLTQSVDFGVCFEWLEAV